MKIPLAIAVSLLIFLPLLASGQVIPKEVTPGHEYQTQKIKHTELFAKLGAKICGSYFADSPPYIYFEPAKDKTGGLNVAIMGRNKFSTKLVQGQKSPTVTFLERYGPQDPIEFHIIV